MKRQLILLFLFFIANFALLNLHCLWAESPKSISYQGRLRESGQPVSGTRSIQFKLFDASSAGAEVFNSGAQSIYVSSGIFGYQLGGQNFKDLSWATSSYWLEISVGGNAMTPRERINAMPYAFMASTAASLNGSGNIQITGAGNHYILNGNVGIGRTNPYTKLHINGPVSSTGYNNTGFSAGGAESSGELNAYFFRQNIGGDLVNRRSYVTILSNNAYYNGTDWIRRNQYAQPAIVAIGGDGTGGGVFRYMIGSAGSEQDQVFTPAELFRITPSGNVGIGTTNPQENLHVTGRLRVDTVTTAESIVTNVSQTGTDNTDLTFDTAGAPSLSLGAGTWLIYGSCTMTTAAYAADLIFLAFKNITDGIVFGKSASSRSTPSDGPINISTMGYLTVTSGTKTIRLHGMRNGNSTLILGNYNVNAHCAVLRAIRLY